MIVVDSKVTSSEFGDASACFKSTNSGRRLPLWIPELFLQLWVFLSGAVKSFIIFILITHIVRCQPLWGSFYTPRKSKCQISAFTVPLCQKNNKQIFFGMFQNTERKEGICLGSRHAGAIVITFEFVSLQFGLVASILAPGVICGLSLFLILPLLWGFSPVSPAFLPAEKTKFSNSIRLGWRTRRKTTESWCGWPL